MVSETFEIGVVKEARRTKRLDLTGLTFNDVTIHPSKSNTHPRDVSISSEILKGLVAPLPVMASPMKSVWSVELTIALSEVGGLAPIERDLPSEALSHAIETISRTRLSLNRFPFALHKNGRPILCVASSPFDESKVEHILRDPRVDYVLLDSVQPFSDHVLRRAEKWSVAHPKKLILGNIVTFEAAKAFCHFPLAAIKVGLGSGSICTTRTFTGIGVPQLEAIQQVCAAAQPAKIPVISDGGITTFGDIGKAIAAGASAVMMGRYWAGTKESPGEILEVGEKKFKQYAGSEYTTIEFRESDPTISDEANAFLKESYANGFRMEGVSGLIPYAGPAHAVAFQIRRSLSASLAFSGSSDIETFKKNAVLGRISGQGFLEGTPQGMTRIEKSNFLEND